MVVKLQSKLLPPYLDNYDFYHNIIILFNGISSVTFVT